MKNSMYASTCMHEFTWQVGGRVTQFWIVQKGGSQNPVWSEWGFKIYSSC